MTRWAARKVVAGVVGRGAAVDSGALGDARFAHQDGREALYVARRAQRGKRPPTRSVPREAPPHADLPHQDDALTCVWRAVEVAGRRATRSKHRMAAVRYPCACGASARRARALWEAPEAPPRPAAWCALRANAHARSPHQDAINALPVARRRVG